MYLTYDLEFAQMKALVFLSGFLVAVMAASAAGASLTIVCGVDYCHYCIAVHQLALQACQA